MSFVPLYARIIPVDDATYQKNRNECIKVNDIPYKVCNLPRQHNDTAALLEPCASVTKGRVKKILEALVKSLPDGAAVCDITFRLRRPKESEELGGC